MALQSNYELKMLSTTPKILSESTFFIQEDLGKLRGWLHDAKFIFMLIPLNENLLRPYKVKTTVTSLQWDSHKWSTWCLFQKVVAWLGWESTSNVARDSETSTCEGTAHWGQHAAAGTWSRLCEGGAAETWLWRLVRMWTGNHFLRKESSASKGQEQRPVCT